MEATLRIPFMLPNLNEYINAERTNRFKAADMKRKSEQKILWFIRAQLRGVKFEKPVSMHYLWIEKNIRRDKDNISSFGRKVIQDALVKSGVLQDDGWEYIMRFTDDFDVDAKSPGIVVTITDEE